MPTPRIKVLQIQNRYHIDATDLAEQIITALPRDQFETTSAFLHGHPDSGEVESGAEASAYLHLTKRALKGIRINATRKLYRLIRKHRYDVVIAHRFKPIHMLMMVNHLLPIPVCIGVIHGIGDFDRSYRKWQMRKLIKPNWRMVGVSGSVRDDLAAAGCGFTDSNLCVINNAIDVRQAEAMQLSKQEARRMLDLPEQAFIFGAIGRLVPVKGHRYLICAFAEIARTVPDAHLAIIGGGRVQQELEALINSFELAGRIHLLGQREHALQFVRAYDVFVMPSLSEGLPLALLEGLSARLPVIGTDIPSMRAIIEGAGGECVPAKNVDNLATALWKYSQTDPATLSAMGDRAYCYLSANHDIGPFHQQYRNLIEEALASTQCYGCSGE